MASLSARYKFARGENFYTTGVSALMLNGLYNFDSIQLETPTDREDLNKKCSILMKFIYDNKYDFKHYIAKDKTTNTFLPTAERAIVDYIRQGRIYEEALYYSIDTYLQRYGTREKLLEVAEFYNMREEVEKHIDATPQWMEEFYAEY